MSNILKRELHEELKSNYLDYAEETTQERAIADIRDGLKPVHIRTLYDMKTLKLTSDAKYVKCARVVGDVLGKYHPHSNDSEYGALVGLAQPWSMRYPLIDFKGNVGSIDGDPAAAMRYTECKLTKVGEEMTSLLNKDTVDFVPNFDETFTEPVFLPTLLPNYLMNGSEGIACGFAPKIPSHNLSEIYNACIFMLDGIVTGELGEIEEDKLEDYLTTNIAKHIQGPDFPTGGVIVDNKEWMNIIKNGKGKVVLKAKYEIIENKRKEKQMVITEIPYQVNKLSLVEKIEDLIDNGVIEGIKEIIDSSSGGKVKIVITFKKNANYEVVINNLLSRTELKKNINYNMYGLKDKELLKMNIISAIDEFLEHCTIVIKRESQYEYNKCEKRINLVQAMLKVQETEEHVEKAIHIIRYSKKPIEDLMEEFDLTKEQAIYVEDRKVNQFSTTQLKNLRKEEETLLSEMDSYEAIIENKDNAMYLELKGRLLMLQARFGDERKTAIELESELTNEDLIPDENIVITITSEGNIKSVLESEYTSQRRGGKGQKGAAVKDNEIITQLFTLSSKDDILFVTNQGRIHRIKAYKIPQTSKSAKGKNIVNYINLDENETLVKTLATRIDFESDNQYIIFVTDKGQIKRMSLNLLNRRGTTTKVIKLKDDHEIVDVELVSENDDILIATSKGNCVRYNSSIIRPQGKTAQGVIGIKMKTDGDKVVGLTKVLPKQDVLTITELALAKKTPESEYSTAKAKGGKGFKCHKISDKTKDIVSVLSLKDEDLLIATEKGKIIRITSTSIRNTSRDTTGVKALNLDKNDKVKTVSLAPVSID